MQGEPLRWLTILTPRPVGAGQKIRPPLFEEQVMTPPIGGPGRGPNAPSTKSARQPRSTQMPRRLKPQVEP